MNRFPDLLPGFADGTPLRGDYPRFRRSELPDGAKSIIPRKWLLSPIQQEAISEDPEQRNTQKFDPKCIKTKVYSLISKQTYSGDRFIPCRRGYNSEMAHYLLMKDDMNNEKNIIDVCEQVNSLETKYQRKVMRALMIETGLMPELVQNRILRFSGLIVPRNPLHLKYEKETWKCRPRKKPLITSAEKMLSMPNRFRLRNIRAIDWSCNDMLAVAHRNLLDIYDNNGDMLPSYTLPKEIYDIYNKIINIKWSDDGRKLIMVVFDDWGHFSAFTLYDLKEKKILWKVKCTCIFEFRGRNDSSTGGCAIHCICWSAHDREIVTGCSGKISIYESNTGKLLNSYPEEQPDNISDFLILSFSPNFKYLVSTAKDKFVRIFAWPKLIPCYDIKFFDPVQAIAWHPQVSDLFCIGTGALTFWNVNECVSTAFVNTKFNGRVENLVWNKLNGELVVHWTYKEGDNIRTIVAVLASCNQIVDALPLDKETELMFLKFNAAHEQLITFCSNNICSIWNFFGNEKSFQERRTRNSTTRQRHTGVLVHNLTR